MTKSAAKKSYLEVSYNEKTLPRTQYPQIFASYLHQKHFKKPGSLLDVGCGRGEYLEAFQSSGFNVTGVDLSPTLDEMKHQFQVQRCDFENEALPFSDDTYDYIFSKSVVEHLHCPEKLVDQCFRVLKSGGKAIFMCPSWIHTYWGPFYIDHTHVTPFTLPSLCQLLELSGFNIISAQHFTQLPIVWKIPAFKLLSELTALFPLPFRPLYNSPLPENINKWIRFSKEKMLLVCAEKP